MTRKPAKPAARGARRSRDPGGESETQGEMELAGERARRVLAVRFREARNAAGLTQREIHERSRVDIASISKIEAADWNPSVNTLARLALALGVPIATLFAEGVADEAEGDPAAPEPDEDPTSED